MSDTSSEAGTGRVAALEPIDAADRRRALLIVNPHATAVSERLRNLVVHALSTRYEIETAETEARGHATELAREGARDGC